MTNLVKPRHEMTIDTPSSYFDQTIGLSQGIINRSFKRVFDMVKEKGGKVAKMILNTESQGMLNAELDAPSVFIMGASEETRIFYLLRLKSGIATLESGQELDLSGWSFAVETPLRKTVLSAVAGDTEDEMNEKERIMKEIGDKYRGFVAGDYRVQRVFCALAEANWMTPDGTWSKAVVNGESMKLRDWRKTNDTAYNSLNVLLRLWAERQRDPTITSMGLQFELDPEKKLASQPNPTFRPVNVVMQTYPYRTIANDLGETGCGSYEEGGKLVGGDYNCLLYCEMVDSKDSNIESLPEYKARTPPGQSNLNWSANFAEPDGPYGEIPGSFVMDHRVFLEVFLLPQLQELCMATKFECGSAVPYDEDGTHYSRPVWALGQPLPGGQRVEASDSSFKFNDMGRCHYQWTFNSESPNNKNVHEHYTTWYQRNCFSRVDNSSASKVDVTWSPGGTRMTIKGNVVYNFKVEFAHDRNMSEDVQRLSYTLTCNWTLELALLEDSTKQFVRFEFDKSKFVMKNGYLVPHDFSVEASPGERKGVIGGDKDVLRDTMAQKLGYHMTCVQRNLTTFFEGRGIFVFPGHGSLNFTKPILTAEGDLVAVAEYAPVSADGTVSFPDASISLKPPSKPLPTTTKLPPTKRNLGTPKLDWDMNFRYDATRKVGWLEFTIKNKDYNAPVRLEYLSLRLVPYAGKGITTRLFPSEDWHSQDESLLQSMLYLIKHFTIDAVHDWFASEEKETQKPETTEKPTEGLTPTSDPDEGRKPKAKGSEATGKASDGTGTTTSTGTDSGLHLKAKDVYGLAYGSDWTGAKELGITVRPKRQDLGIDFTVSQRKGNKNIPFEIAPHESITIAVQGKVEGPATYMIMAQEEWAAPQGQEKDTQSDWTSQAWKVVTIKENGETDYFDVGKRLGEETEKK
ncbi:hypothetical protein ACHAPE_004867 [Trichoderma viride]